jgi:hypothetical protein
VHSSEAALRWPRLPRKFHRLNACRTADFAVRQALEHDPEKVEAGFPKRSCSSQRDEHDPEKGKPVFRKIMLKQRDEIVIRSNPIGS